MRKGKQLLALQRTKMLDLVRQQDPEVANKLASMQFDWYSLKNSVDADEATLYIYDEIMPAYLAEWFGGVSAEGLIAELNKISAKTINVRINSPGGSVFEAIAIYNALVSHDATINVYVDALAASAASVIAMSGDKVTMMVGSQMMIHDAMGIEMGNAKDLRDFATFLDKQSDNIASVYANKAGGDVADWRALMVAETWLFANETVEYGLADEIYSKPPPIPNPDPDEDEDEPDKEGEEGESDKDKPDEEGDEDETTDTTDEELEALMRSRHRLSNRGFKYTGRSKAPNPSANDQANDRAWVNQLIDAMPGSK